jgi:TonB C terminal
MAIKSFASARAHQGTIFLTLCCFVFSFLSSLAAPVEKKHSAPGPQTSTAGKAYLNNLRQSLLKNWELIDGNNTVILEGIINLDGSISELRSTSSSNTNALAIESAMSDVERCKPLPPLPSNYKHSCKLTLTFHSTVDPHGDSDSNLTTEMTEIQDVPTQKQ